MGFRVVGAAANRGGVAFVVARRSSAHSRRPSSHKTLESMLATWLSRASMTPFFTYAKVTIGSCRSSSSLGSSLVLMGSEMTGLLKTKNVDEAIYLTKMMIGNRLKV